MTNAASGDDWIKARLLQARDTSPDVSSPALALLESLLTGPFLEERLPSKKVGEIADTLLNAQSQKPK